MDSSFDRRALPPGLQIGEWRADDGWLIRRFDWAPAGSRTRGSMIFQAGRGDFLEKYLEIYAYFVGQGWHVSGFDWRGQGGSGRLRPPSLEPLLDDLDAFTAQWREAAPAPHVLVGHSMGGHLMLRLMAERPVSADAAVLVAPMLGLNSGPIPPILARAIARTLCRLGLGDRQAVREGDRPARFDIARQANLTNCVERYADEAWWKVERPELALETPSWGWIVAAYESIARLERRGELERVTIPTLLLGAKHDRLVSAEAIRRAAARLKDARLIMSNEAAHEMLREVDEVRLALLGEVDHFLAQKAPQR